MDNKELFELNDEELGNVVGGISVGDQVIVDTRMVRYCPQCSRLAMSFEGTDVGKIYYEKAAIILLM